MKKYIAWLVFFVLLEISLALYLTYWRESFWNAISTKNDSEFLTQLSLFSIVALTICFISGMSGYLTSLAAIKWRKTLNSRAFLKSNGHIENLNQRIQEDCMLYPDLSFTLLFGTLKSTIYIITFTISLLFSFSWILLSILVVYSLIGTILAKYIAQPLIGLNYEQQKREATYRNQLTVNNFSACIFMMLGIARRQKRLTYFQQFYGQVGVVLPLIIIAPYYFNSGMLIGSLMRFNSLSSTLLENMSYGINTFSTINKWISCRRRLREAEII